MDNEVWECYARPASQNGARCGHVNKNGGIWGPGWAETRLRCCEKCGCTKKASDDRRARLEASYG